MANWKTFEVQVPGKDLLEPVREGMEVMLVTLDTLQAILDTLKVFLVDFGNPMRSLVEALIRLVEEAILAMKATECAALYHVPNPVIDPNFQLNTGYGSFVDTFKQSLYDTRDMWRPQPRIGSTKGGFALLMVQADSPYALLERVKVLMSFFSKEFTAPRYEAPLGFSAFPVGSDGDAILSVAGLFNNPPEAVELKWSLPSSCETPDPGFSDLVNRAAHEFYPPKWLIEKSTINPAASKISIDQIWTPEVAGQVEFTREVTVAGTSQTASKWETLRDQFGEPVVKFTEYKVLNQLDLSSIAGMTGTVRYIDSDIEPNTTYYYRVRALSGDLAFTSDGQLDWGDPKALNSRDVPCVPWPGDAMPGKATSIVQVTLPKEIPDFDVVDNLRRLFQTAYSLDFHRNDADLNFIGQGLLLNLAGTVGPYLFHDTFAQAQAISADASNADSINLPCREYQVLRQSAKVSDAVASSLVQQSAMVLQFRDLMQRPRTLLGEGSLEAALQRYASTAEEEPDQGTAVWAFVEGFDDDDFRAAVVEAVTLLKDTVGAGMPPDWVSVNVLRDIVPWSGQILYEILDKVQALYDAAAGVVSEINGFIDLLSRKIDTLERTLEFLISLLDIVESLQLGAYVLYVPEVEGGVEEWVRMVDEATGAPPLEGSDGYAAGVAMAYVAPNVDAFKSAFSLIFGA